MPAPRSPEPTAAALRSRRHDQRQRDALAAAEARADALAKRLAALPADLLDAIEKDPQRVRAALALQRRFSQSSFKKIALWLIK